MVLIATYTIFVLRLAIGHPSPKVDYIAQFNAPILKTSTSDRAWPIWKVAILDLTERDSSGELVEPAAFEFKLSGDRRQENWPVITAWLGHHSEGLEAAREAASRPTMGFILGAQGSIDDPKLFPHVHGPFDNSVISVLLPHLNPLRTVAVALSYDLRLAAETGDGHRCYRDVSALLGMAEQLRKQNFVISDLVSVGIDATAISRCGVALTHHASAFSDEDLIALAHQLSGPNVAADLVSLDGDEIRFVDAVQRIYTDDGNGDGRLTLAGLRNTSIYLALNGKTAGFHPWDELMMPFAAASRADVIARYDEWNSRQVANFARPMRDRSDAADQAVARWSHSSLDRSRYVVLMPFLDARTRLQTTAERALGAREGAIVAIACELFHRRHGQYPWSLTELTPDILPAIPADRITGEPLHYRMIEGKPVIYSVGADRVDNGGQPAIGRDHEPDPSLAAVWDVKPSAAPRGDWVLYPPAADE